MGELDVAGGLVVASREVFAARRQEGLTGHSAGLDWNARTAARVEWDADGVRVTAGLRDSEIALRWIRRGAARWTRAAHSVISFLLKFHGEFRSSSG